jgi:endonuclease III related protein
MLRYVALPCGRETPMKHTNRTLDELYSRLLAAFGHRNWWPAKTAEEVIFGAILTQNVAWTSVEKAIAALRLAARLNFKSIADMDEAELAALIRAARFMNQKAKALKAFAEYFGTQYGFSLRRMKKCSTEALREQLLSLYRIGPETADSILLYALEKPVFVIDAYTKRICSRHGLLGTDDPYAVYQRFFMERLACDAGLFNDFHAQLVHLGNRFCKTRPLCSDCPLQDFNTLPFKGNPAKKPT